MDCRRGPHGLNRPCIRDRSALHGPHLVHLAVLGVEELAARPRHHHHHRRPIRPPPRLQEHVVTRRVRGRRHWHSRNSRASSRIGLPRRCPRADLPSFPTMCLAMAAPCAPPAAHNYRMGARGTPAQAGLQCIPLGPEQPHPQRVPMLDCAVALVLAGARHLTHGRPRVQVLHRVPQGIAGLLITGLENTDPWMPQSLRPRVVATTTTTTKAPSDSPCGTAPPGFSGASSRGATRPCPPPLTGKTHNRNAPPGSPTRGPVPADAAGYHSAPPTQCGHQNAEWQLRGLITLPLCPGRGTRAAGPPRPPRPIATNSALRASVTRWRGPGARLPNAGPLPAGTHPCPAPHPAPAFPPPRGQRVRPSQPAPPARPAPRTSMNRDFDRGCQCVTSGSSGRTAHCPAWGSRRGAGVRHPIPPRPPRRHHHPVAPPASPSRNHVGARQGHAPARGHMPDLPRVIPEGHLATRHGKYGHAGQRHLNLGHSERGAARPAVGALGTGAMAWPRFGMGDPPAAR